MAFESFFSNRLALFLDKFPNLITASLDLHAKEKNTTALVELSENVEDKVLTDEVVKMMKDINPHMLAIKEEYAKISEKAILKKVEARTATLADIAKLRKKDLLAAEYCILALRKIEGLEDYQYNIAKNSERREELANKEFEALEAQAKKEAETEMLAKEKVSFFLNTDAFDEALLAKTEELMLEAEIEDVANVKSQLTDLVGTIMSLDEGRKRLLELFPDIESPSDITTALIDIYHRASTTMLD